MRWWAWGLLVGVLGCEERPAPAAAVSVEVPVASVVASASVAVPWRLGSAATLEGVTAFAAPGDVIATAEASGVELRDAGTRLRLRNLQKPGPRRKVLGLSASTKELAVSAIDDRHYEVVVYGVPSGRVSLGLPEVAADELMVRGSRLAVLSGDGVAWWDLGTGRRAGEAAVEGPPRDLQMSGDGECVAWYVTPAAEEGGPTHTVAVWRLSEPAPRIYAVPALIAGIGFAGSVLHVVQMDEQTLRFACDGGRLPALTRAADMPRLRLVAFHPTQPLMVAMGDDDRLRAIALDEEGATTELGDKLPRVDRIAVAADGSRLFASVGARVSVWPLLPPR
ncbi:MAG: hypothetical protein R3B72_24200 [Polyangiaceae bacterium]